MQTFSYKIAKLTDRITVEVDKRWTRATTSKGQVHIDFKLVDSINYWVVELRGAALTGHLVIRDRQGRTLSLKCSGFGMDNDIHQFLLAASTIMRAIAEVRPDLRVAPEPTPGYRHLMAGIIMAAVIVIGAAMYAFDNERDWTRAGGPIAGVLIALGVVLFRFGPLRKKPAPMAPANLAPQIAAPEALATKAL